MRFLDYDYNDLARQIQTGLERICVNFLRSHGARVRRDSVDFHGHEQIDLELEHGAHRLTVHQVGRPRGVGEDPGETRSGGLAEEFESTFDGWPAANQPREAIARWLRSLPVGEAAPEPSQLTPGAPNPFLSETPAQFGPRGSEVGFNPFFEERGGAEGPNPFLDPDRRKEREEMLRRLRGDED